MRISKATACAQTQVATASLDSSVRAWTILDGTCAAVLTGHKDKVLLTPLHSRPAPSPPAARCNSTAKHVDTVLPWLLAAGACAQVIAVAWSPSDPALLLSGSLDATAKLWAVSPAGAAAPAESGEGTPRGGRLVFTLAVRASARALIPPG